MKKIDIPNTSVIFADVVQRLVHCGDRIYISMDV